MAVKKRNTVVKTSKVSTRLRFVPALKVSYKTATVLIFVLLFSNIGAILLARSSASTIPSVQYVLFCPQGAACDSTAVSNLRNSAIGNQGWYLRQTGKTFTLGGVYSIRGYKTGAAYGNYDTGAAYYNIRAELDRRGITHWTRKTVILTTSRVASNCGVAEYNGYLAIADPFARADGICFKLANEVLAHELGHSFNLGHLRDGTLMHEPLACNGNYLGNCSLNQAQKNGLLAFQGHFFNRTSK